MCIYTQKESRYSLLPVGPPHDSGLCITNNNLLTDYHVSKKKDKIDSKLLHDLTVSRAS